jgi:hypothetical protein
MALVDRTTRAGVVYSRPCGALPYVEPDARSGTHGASVDEEIPAAWGVDATASQLQVSQSYSAAGLIRNGSPRSRWPMNSANELAC